MVCLTAPILTRSFVPPFTGSIDVDVAAEDVNGQLQPALFGKHCITIL